MASVKLINPSLQKISLNPDFNFANYDYIFNGGREISAENESLKIEDLDFEKFALIGGYDENNESNDSAGISENTDIQAIANTPADTSTDKLNIGDYFGGNSGGYNMGAAASASRGSGIENPPDIEISPNITNDNSPDDSSPDVSSPHDGISEDLSININNYYNNTDAKDTPDITTESVDITKLTENNCRNIENYKDD